MSIIGKILFSLSIVLILLFIDLIMILFASFIIRDHSYSAAYFIICIFYTSIALGILFFHWVAVNIFIDIYNLSDKVGMFICNLIYRNDPCNECLSLAVCQRDRMCNDFKHFIFKRRNLFEKIKWHWLA